MGIVNNTQVQNGKTKKTFQCIPFLCFVRNNICRGSIDHPDCGFANGYVAVTKEHPWWGKDIEEIENLVSVHGDITFAAEWKRFPFPVMKLTDKEIPEDSWIFGFDTLHDNDTLEKCNEEFCKEETFKLMKQLEDV